MAVLGLLGCASISKLERKCFSPKQPDDCDITFGINMLKMMCQCAKNVQKMCKTKEKSAFLNSFLASQLDEFFCLKTHKNIFCLRYDNFIKLF